VERDEHNPNKKSHMKTKTIKTTEVFIPNPEAIQGVATTGENRDTTLFKSGNNLEKIAPDRTLPDRHRGTPESEKSFPGNQLKRNIAMRGLKLCHGLVVLTLMIATATIRASAQSPDPLSISGTFHMDQLTGTVGADLAEVFARNNDHSWLLTLHGVTLSNKESYDFDHDIDYFITRVHAMSFDFEFVGPDADVLNAVISQQLTRSSLGGGVFLELENIYSYGGLYPGGATWNLGLLPLDESTGVSFFAGAWNNYLTGKWFPAAHQYYNSNYGFPIVESLLVTSQKTSIQDSRPGKSGVLASIGDEVNIGSSVPPPAPTVSIYDGSVREGSRGTTALNLTVMLSASSLGTVSVNYATADGTAIAGSDYYSKSGAVTFQPGQTSRTISISVKGDRNREPNETFTVRIFGAVGATIHDAIATATIENDDKAK
jgi:Calx-beta domain